MCFQSYLHFFGLKGADFPQTLFAYLLRNEMHIKSELSKNKRKTKICSDRFIKSRVIHLFASK